MTDRVAAAMEELRQRRPLIHCLTNHITIESCANVILAAGGRPIMAEHPDEAAQITETAQALELNLGNIQESRMEAMRRSGKCARALHIPVTLDPVGITCSTLRQEFTRWLLTEVRPTVVRGNRAELQYLAGLPAESSGIDAAGAENTDETIALTSAFAAQQHTVAAATGAVDVISDGNNTWLVENGTPLLRSVTGTGCMCAALTAAYSAVCDPLTAAVSAAAVLGLAGEWAAAHTSGIGSFRIALFDAIWNLDASALRRQVRIAKAEPKRRSPA